MKEKKIGKRRDGFKRKRKNSLIIELISFAFAFVISSLMVASLFLIVKPLDYFGKKIKKEEIKKEGHASIWE